MGSPNFQLSNYISALLCGYVSTDHQFFVQLHQHKSALSLRLTFQRTLYHLKVIHKVQYSTPHRVYDNNL